MKALLYILSLVTLTAESNAFECKYRDGWYIPHFIEISCLETGCPFVIRTRQSEVDGGKLTRVQKFQSQEGLNRIEIGLGTGPTIQVERTLGKRYEGMLFFGNGSFGASEKIHCRDSNH